MDTKKPRKQRKPAQVEKIFTSVIDENTIITTHQKIAEQITLARADFLGIKFVSGEKFYEHPDLKDFYQSLWGDISNAIRRFGGRVVISVLETHKWCCNPKYGNGNPLRMKKFIEAAKKLMSEQPSELAPTNYTTEPTKKRNY